MKKFVIALAVAVAALGFAACEKEGPPEGYVTDKTYDDPDDWMSTYCAAYDTKGRCVYWATQQHHDGEHFWLELKSSKKNGDGEYDQGWREVRERVYDECQIGNYCDVHKGRVPR